MTKEELLAFVIGAMCIMAHVMFTAYLMINHSYLWILLFLMVPSYQYSSSKRGGDNG